MTSLYFNTESGLLARSCWCTPLIQALWQWLSSRPARDTENPCLKRLLRQAQQLTQAANSSTQEVEGSRLRFSVIFSTHPVSRSVCTVRDSNIKCTADAARGTSTAVLHVCVRLSSSADPMVPRTLPTGNSSTGFAPLLCTDSRAPLQKLTRP